MTEPTTQPGAADGYAAAMAELQRILSVLEAPDVDVDALAAHVDRAAELIRFCRERLVAAETQVTDIVAGLEDLTDDAAGAAEPTADRPDPRPAGTPEGAHGSEGGVTSGETH